MRPLELLAFAGYEAVFVVAPGVLLLHALLRRRGSPLTRLAIGWPLGHVVELAAFALTAAVGARWLFFLYPPIACGLALLSARRRGPGAGPERAAVARGPAWASAGVIALALVLLGLGPFASNPLPRTVPSVALHPDSVFHVGLAAEARHRWPMSDPNVAGEPLRYHVFVHMQAAAIAQTTGVPLDVIVLRLQPVLIMLLIGLQLAWLAGRVARGSPWVAPGAVAIALLANELDIDTERDSPFVGLFFTDLPLSPTFAFALPPFIAILGILVGLLTRPGAPERGTWALLAALFAGAMGAKASTLPVLMAGLGVFLACRFLFDRVIDRRAIGALGVASGVFVILYVALFSGGGDAGGKIEPFAFLDYAVLAGAFDGPLLALLGDAARTAALLAPWLGGLLLIGRVRGDDRGTALLLAAVALGAFLPFVFFAQPGLAQIYFLNYGTPAAAVLSAWGISAAWRAMRERAETLGALAAAVVAALVLSAVLRERIPEEEAPTVVGYLGIYTVLVALLVLLAVVAARPPRRALALLLGLLVAVCLLDKPLDVLPRWSEDRSADRRHYDADARDGPRGVDGELRAGLRWVRDHSAAADVLATDVQTTTVTGEQARYFYPAAYAERRTFLGGWDYTTEGIERDAAGRADPPFAGLRALNEAAFRGERRALRALRRDWDVRYLLVDLRHGPARPVLDRELRRVYANPALRVYRLD